MKRGFYSRETSDSRQACHGLMTGLSRTHDRLVTDSRQACHGLTTGLSRTRDRLAMDSRQACHELVESYLRSRTMNILIGRGAYFLKNKIVCLIIKHFGLFFLCFLQDNNNCFINKCEFIGGRYLFICQFVGNHLSLFQYSFSSEHLHVWRIAVFS